MTCILLTYYCTLTCAEFKQISVTLEPLLKVQFSTTKVPESSPRLLGVQRKLGGWGGLGMYKIDGLSDEWETCPLPLSLVFICLLDCVHVQICCTNLPSLGQWAQRCGPWLQRRWLPALEKCWFAACKRWGWGWWGGMIARQQKALECSWIDDEQYGVPQGTERSPISLLSAYNFRILLVFLVKAVGQHGYSHHHSDMNSKQK